MCTIDAPSLLISFSVDFSSLTMSFPLSKLNTLSCAWISTLPSTQRPRNVLPGRWIGITSGIKKFDLRYSATSGIAKFDLRYSATSGIAKFDLRYKKVRPQVHATSGIARFFSRYSNPRYRKVRPQVQKRVILRFTGLLSAMLLCYYGSTFIFPVPPAL